MRVALKKKRIFVVVVVLSVFHVAINKASYLWVNDQGFRTDDLESSLSNEAIRSYEPCKDSNRGPFA